MGLLLQKQSVLFLFLLFSGLSSIAQPNTSIDLDKDKPKQYENRKLRSEKTETTKFSAGKRFYQNLVTHYNYFFNANNKLNDVILRAKSGYRDDYSHLISFYNYTLDATSQQKQQLDSVIYKCNAGILLHDLRSDWIDDMYMLLGKAYLLKKNYDSAQQVFQYINYIYAPKDDGYDIPIGSNASRTDGVFSISTEEKTNLYKKITSKPPSRNESFIWQARNYLEQNKVSEAVGLLAILKADPKFPLRLKTDLNEMIAYAYYKQNAFDSAAVYLQKSLDNADGKSEIGRWEFLAGQLYQQSGMTEAAEKMYTRAIKHTIDPYLDVYARLNLVALSSSKNKSNAIQDNLNELYKLAKRDKYENYRDIIYYATAVLQQQQNNIGNAKSDLKKSLHFGIDNPTQKQKSFLLLADLNYDSKNYNEAFNNYDSIQTSALNDEDRTKVEKRKPALKLISENLAIIHLQDSLLNLAQMSEADRLAAVKKIYKQIRKEQGLKELADNDFGSYAGNNTNNTSLFGNNGTNTSGFYFLNASVKAQGFKDFKTRWGNRPNVDNWQRQNAITKFNTTQNNPSSVVDIDQPQPGTATPDSKEVILENLLLNIPLTEKKMQTATERIAKSYFSNGLTFQNKLEEYRSAANNYDSILNRYPIDKDLNEQSLFNIAFCYFKLGEPNKFDSAKNLLNTKFADGKYSDKLNNNSVKEKTDATKTYEQVYNLFIEGNFNEAKAAKQAADNKFGNTFWTPQLLYIESIYYIKQKQDSIAINRLQSIISKFPSEALAEKSKTMIDVLKRRNEIESYLTNLQIDSIKEDVLKRVDLDTVAAAKAPVIVIKKDTAVTKTTAATKEIRTEVKPIVIADAGFSLTPTDPHYVVLVMNKVDEVFVNESKNAFSRFNRERYYNQKIDLNGFKLNNEFSLLLMGPFNSAGEAVNYIDNIKAAVSTRIIPWLTADKYYFNIISNTNLDKVKAAKDITPYSKFLKQAFPDKF